MAVAQGIIEEVKKVPLISHSTLRLLEIVSDPGYELAQVVEIVKCDPVLTAHVIKRVNSSLMGLAVPVETVSRAVGYLGSRMILGLALENCAPEIFNKELKGYESGPGELWEHSLKTAIAAREVAVFTKNCENPDLAYTAGLLHDIGKAVLSQFLQGSARSILSKIDTRTLPGFLEGEREVLGTNHCEVGSELAEHWRLPPTLTAAIRHHHAPKQADPSLVPLCYCVHLGDFVAMMQGSGTGVDSFRYRLDERYREFIPIPSDELMQVMVRVQDEFERTSTLLFAGEGF